MIGVGKYRIGRITYLYRGGVKMKKMVAVILVVASVLFVAPLIESGTSSSTQVFVTHGNADAGGF